LTVNILTGQGDRPSVALISYLRRLNGMVCNGGDGFYKKIHRIVAGNDRNHCVLDGRMPF
jgi:hypothetical protein